MTSPRTRHDLTPGLVLGLAFLVMSASSAPAQLTPSGPAAGTMGRPSADAARNPTGTGRAATTQPPAGPPVTDQPIPLGPGATVRFPGEEPIMPLDAVEFTRPEGGSLANQQSAVTENQLRYARRIPGAGDRSLALSRIASAATFSNQLEVAERALTDSSDAALLMHPGLVQDQRLISIVTALMGVAEARLREARTGSSTVDVTVGPESGGKPAPTPLPGDERGRYVHHIQQAQSEWRKAATLALRVSDPTYRSEVMYRVADNVSFGSQSLANEPSPNAAEVPPGNKRGGPGRPDENLPDQLLQEAASVAAQIDRPVWHDQALYKVTTAAAESRQYARAMTIARMIPSPEVRTNALLKIAELQARRGDPTGATGTYREAALAVASMTQDDPRAVLAGVLIDSLISVGRFDDARASVVLYPDETRQVVALGAVAESQGRRGSGQSAVQWINATVAPEHRSWLYRKVNNGIVAAIEDNRRRDLSNREK